MYLTKTEYLFYVESILMQINKESKLILDSAVVRVKKSKKVLDLNNLIDEVVNEVKKLVYS